MAKSPAQKKLDALNKALKQLETQPLPNDVRAAVLTAQEQLTEFSQAGALDQEHARLAALYQVSRVLGSSLDLDEY